MITDAVRSRLSLRIERSLALSRSWSHSTRLFEYGSALWNASDISFSITVSNACTKSVTTSSGSPCAVNAPVRQIAWSEPVRRYSIRMPEMARAMSGCWICSDPVDTALTLADH